MNVYHSKTCKQCEEEKPLTDFYKHSLTRDKHMWKCKVCHNENVIRNRHNKSEKYKEYDRLRGNRQSAAYKWEYRNKNPVATKARQKLNNEIRAGRIVRPSSCEGCGDGCNPHGHHEDYAKPIDVVWLCPSCHMTVHGIKS